MLATLTRALAALALMSAAAAEPIVTIDGGKLAVAVPRGDGVRHYTGIPYAAPPVGEWRWRAPQPVRPWAGVRDAHAKAPNCLQAMVFGDINPFVPAMSEDCLYLNIWTKAEPGQSLPVLVWIHGGGYVAGYGGEPRHDGQVLAQKGVVVVTINYRLGVFGFLAHPELGAESPQGASGNYAFLDMLAALSWVKRNIAAFGGDPDSVTIAGESAGSEAVSRLMASPLARGLFHRAIGESGAAFGTFPDLSLAEAEQNGVKFAHAFDGDDIARLRKRSSAEILAQATAANKRWKDFDPVIDGWFLPQSPAHIFAEGKQNDVPLIVGWNTDEGKSFEGVLGTRNLDQWLTLGFGEHKAQAVKFYPAATAEEEKASRQRLAGDMTMEGPSWSWAMAQIRSGSAPVYLYMFNRHPPIDAEWAKEAGAFHSAEIPYVFGHPDSFADWKPTAEDFALADLMSSYWATFARTGAPAGSGLPDWPRYDPNGKALRMLFDVRSKAETDDSLARHRFMTRHFVMPPPEP